jgi:hypothetical protein
LTKSSAPPLRSKGGAERCPRELTSLSIHPLCGKAEKRIDFVKVLQMDGKKQSKTVSQADSRKNENKRPLFL